jgi:autoinducer 2-degrading protein
MYVSWVVTEIKFGLNGYAKYTESNMIIVHVHVHVKTDQIEKFKAATLVNARQSLQEPGVARFDILQQADDPSKFILVEVYRSADDPARHKETAHYQKWRDAVEPLMAESRTRIVFTNIFPSNKRW